MSFLGTWTHNVAARWTAASLSRSPLVASSVDTLQLAPMVLFTVFAGVLADATDRRRLLVATQVMLAGVATTMGALAWRGHLGLVELLALTAGMGALGALNGPAWQATVPRQVPDAEVPAAVALMSTAFNLARAVGPALGAWTLGTLGAAWAFWANAASYLMIAALLWRLPPQPPTGVARLDISPLTDPALRRLFGAVLVFGFFAMPSLSLLAVVARDLLGGGADTYGALLGAFGAGAVSAGLVVAAGARRFGNRAWVALTALASAAGLGVLSVARTLPTGLLGSAVAGVGWIGTLSTINAAVQVRAPVRTRGRALAFYLTFAVAGQSLGAFVGGHVAERSGTDVALRVSSAGLVAMAIAALRLAR